jgi:hypothetical protein
MATNLEQLLKAGQSQDSLNNGSSPNAPNVRAPFNLPRLTENSFEKGNYDATLQTTDPTAAGRISPPKWP